MGKRWRIHPHDADKIAFLERSAGVSPVVAQLLICRGVSAPSDVRSFLDAKLSSLREPDLLPGLSEAADRVHAAVQQHRKIVIYGDYDADGITAALQLTRFFRRRGVEPIVYLPDRVTDGYGLKRQSIDQLAEKGVTLLITVDTGISAHAEITHAAGKGIDVIVTDHHRPQGGRPGAFAVIHPQVPPGFPNHDLSGSGVAFTLVRALELSLIHI